MSEARIAMRYEAPEIRALGRLSVLTAYDGGGLHFAQAAIGSLPGGGGVQGGGGDNTPGVTTPDSPGSGQGILGSSQTSGTPAHAPGSSGVAGSGSPSGAVPHLIESGSDSVSAGGGSSLPFTGLALGPIAALGAGLTAAGATLRRWARRA